MVAEAFPQDEIAVARTRIANKRQIYILLHELHFYSGFAFMV